MAFMICIGDFVQQSNVKPATRLFAIGCGNGRLFPPHPVMHYHDDAQKNGETPISMETLRLESSHPEQAKKINPQSSLFR